MRVLKLNDSLSMLPAGVDSQGLNKTGRMCPLFIDRGAVASFPGWSSFELLARLANALAAC